MLREYCENDPRLHYVDIVTPMLDAEGKPRRELFVEDELHLNPTGYGLWTQIFSPILADLTSEGPNL